jgi:hypothetical protein
VVSSNLSFRLLQCHTYTELWITVIVKRVTAERAKVNSPSSPKSPSQSQTQSSTLLFPSGNNNSRPPRSSSHSVINQPRPTTASAQQGYNKTLPPRPDAQILDGVSDEKGGNAVGGRLESVELEDRPGARKMGVGGFWARLRCW